MVGIWQKQTCMSIATTILAVFCCFLTKTQFAVATTPNMHGDGSNLYVRAEDFIFEGKPPDEVVTAPATTKSKTTIATTNVPTTNDNNFTDTTSISQTDSTTSGGGGVVKPTTTADPAYVSTATPPLSTESPSVSPSTTVATTFGPTISPTNASVAPTSSPSSAPTPIPTISILSLKADLEAAMDELKIVEKIKSFITSDLTVNTVNDGYDTDQLMIQTQAVMDCVSQSGHLGMHGECIQAVPRCAPIENVPHLEVEYSPPGLAHELLAGVVAKLKCSNSTEYLLQNQSVPLVCLSSSNWNGKISESCAKCSDMQEYCRECSFEACTACEPPRSLFQGKCTVPPGIEEDAPARDCDQLLDHNKGTGSYWIKGSASDDEASLVFCDQETIGGGWTLLTTMQEPLPEEGFTEDYGTSYDKMWIKGCGTNGSNSCESRGVEVGGWRVESSTEASLNSLDWSVMLEKGAKYQLRQTVGVGQYPLNDLKLDFALDIAYTFTYPGFVLQDDAAKQDKDSLVWQLSNQRIIRDDSRNQWDSRKGTIFYPPWSADKNGYIVHGGGSYTYEEYPGTFGMVARGSAGITNVHGFPDPAGAVWFPHMPSDSDTCLIWGPHQADTKANWCGKKNLQGAYWFRRVR